VFSATILLTILDVSLTVHLSITLANDQLDAQIFNIFITILYMYMLRAISCSSSGGQTVQGVQLKSGPYFNMSNLFTKIYNMLYYTTNLYLQ